MKSEFNPTITKTDIEYLDDIVEAYSLDRWVPVDYYKVLDWMLTAAEKSQEWFDRDIPMGSAGDVFIIELDSRIYTGPGIVPESHKFVYVEGLYEADLEYLQGIYHRFHGVKP